MTETQDYIQALNNFYLRVTIVRERTQDIFLQNLKVEGSDGHAAPSR